MSEQEAFDSQFSPNLGQIQYDWARLGWIAAIAWVKSQSRDKAQEAIDKWESEK